MKKYTDVTSLLWVIMVLILIFSFNIGGINRYAIRRDELTTLGHIGALEENSNSVSITHTLESLIFYSSNHAPLYYIITNIWGHFVEFNYFALRMLSAWFGIIAVAGIYWLGGRIISHPTGIFAALILGTNVVFYSSFHEMREWSMVLMLGILTLAQYWHLVHKRKPLKILELLLLFFVVLINLYTNYLLIFILLAIGLYHLFFTPKDKSWWQISITVIVAGLLFIPWLSVLLSGVIMTQEMVANNHPLLMTNMELLPIVSTFWGNGLVALFFWAISLGLMASWINWRKARYIFFFFIIISISILFTNEVFLFVKRIRYLLLWLLPFALLSGMGLAWLIHNKNSRLIPILFIGVWIVSGYYFIQTDEFNFYLAKDRPILYPEYNSLIPLLHQHTQKQDVLILVQYDFSSTMRSKQKLSSIHNYYVDHTQLLIINFPQYFQLLDSDINADSLENVLDFEPRQDEFWLSYHHTRITDDIRSFQDQVEQSFDICNTYKYGERSILVHYVVNNNDKLCSNDDN